MKLILSDHDEGSAHYHFIDNHTVAIDNTAIRRLSEENISHLLGAKTRQRIEEIMKSKEVQEEFNS